MEEKDKEKNGVGDENYHCLINNNATIKHGTCKKKWKRLMVQKESKKRFYYEEFEPS